MACFLLKKKMVNNRHSRWNGTLLYKTRLRKSYKIGTKPTKASILMPLMWIYHYRCEIGDVRLEIKNYLSHISNLISQI